MDSRWRSEEDLNEAIRKLSQRMTSLHAKSVESDIRTNSVRIEVQELAFRNTIREVFGEDSQEFADFGQLQMLHGQLREGASLADLTHARLRGREFMAGICVELIQRLQDEILQHRRHNSAIASEPCATQSEYHPVIEPVVRDLLDSGHLWEAVFAASKALVLYIKRQSGRNDLDGTNLMRTVFSRNSPILKFNELDSQTDMDEQEGMMHLYEGVVMALRNPGAHGFPAGESSTAMQYIQMVSLLAFRADEAER